jgi:hypothetical protein
MRQRWRTLIGSLVVATMLVMQIAGPLAAAPTVDPAAPTDVTAYGIQCKEDVCTLRIKEAGIAVPGAVAAGAALLFTFLQDQIRVLPEGTGLQITDDVTLQTPMGKLALFDTDMIIELAPDNSIERLRGTAQIPWPALLGSTVGVERALAVADIGLELGKYLSHLTLPLVAEQSYFYMRLGLGVQTDATGAPQRETLHAIDTPVTRGQHLTVLIDPQQLDLWIDGNLTVALLDDWLLVNEFLTDQTGLPFELASEAVNVHLSGLLSLDVADSYLRLDGLYTLEKQFIRNWFQTDASPLAVTGSLLINNEGMLLSGLTRSSIMPDRLFDGEMRVEAFLPLGGNLWEAYVATGGQADLPLWAMQGSGEQQLSAMQLRPFVDRALAQAHPLFLVVKDSATDAVLYAGRGYQVTKTAAGDSYAWTVETLTNGVTSGAASATQVAQASVRSVQELAAISYDWTSQVIATGAANSAEMAQNAFTWTTTTVHNGAATVADTVVDVTANGYRATRNFAGNTYTWTANTTSLGAATVGTVASDSYTALACGVTSGVAILTTWAWPSAQAADEPISSE